jgi:hypothetical protein
VVEVHSYMIELFILECFFFNAYIYDMGKIMKLGYTFVTIGSPKFLAAIFRPNKYYFRPKYYSVENLHVKFNGAVKIRVQCFLNELFSCGKNISAEILFGRNVYFLTDSVKN